VKPFNLNETLAGRPVVTADGRKVLRVIHVPEADVSAKLIAVVKQLDGSIVSLHYYEDGRYYETLPSGLDLQMVSTKKTYYVNIYPGDFYKGQKLNGLGNLSIGEVHASKAIAENSARVWNAMTTVSFEVEE